MKSIYSPCRDSYTTQDKSKKECPFCKQLKENIDEKNYILKRYKHCAVFLNLYPYNAGHLLIIPFEHKNSLEYLTPEVRAELMEITTKMLILAKEALNADGINIGLNIGGKAAGGSIPDHLHIHLIPRYLGDTNFLITSANTNVIGQNLNNLYDKLSQKLNKQL